MIKEYVIFLLELVLFASVISTSQKCPDRCVCLGQTISCRNTGHKTVPVMPTIVPGLSGGALQFLLIIQNPIIRLEKGTFDKQLDLLRLELSYNQLVWISPKAFIGLPMLKSLSLRSNRLAYLPENVFTPVHQLEVLDLSRNQLKKLPFSVEGLINLKRLSLVKNPLHCPCEMVDFALSLMYFERKQERVKCYSPQEVRDVKLNDLGNRMRSFENHTRLLGYQSVDESERSNVIKNQPYTPTTFHHHWPWSHCPRQDFGGKTPLLFVHSNNESLNYNLDDHQPEQNYGVPNLPQRSVPIFAVKPISVGIVAGEIARFICIAQHGSNAQLTWILPPTASKYIRLYRRRQILEITEVHDYHEGTYTCVISNEFGTVTSEAILRLIQPVKPKIIDAPSADSNTAQENSLLDLECTAKGKPKPHISWLWIKDTLPLQLVTEGRYIVRTHNMETNNFAFNYKEELSVYTADSHLLSVNENDEASSILLVRNITAEDAHGRYICYVSNRAGSQRVSAIIQVVANTPKPSIKRENERPLEGPMSTNTFEALDSDELVRQVIEKARIRIDAAIKKTADKLRDTGRRRSSADVASLFRQPNRAALELAKAAEVYEAAIDEVTSILRQRNQKQLELNETVYAPEYYPVEETHPHLRETLGVQLNSDQLAIIAQLSGCQEPIQIDPCSKQLCFHLRYRTIDGTCNNLNHPRWGAALAPFKRLLPPKYENNINTPIGWSPSKLYFGYPKPSARLVSRELLGNANLMRKHEMRLEEMKNRMSEKKMPHITSNTYDNHSSKSDPDHSEQDKLFDEDDASSGMLMQWGQFLDHDLDFTPVDASTSRFSDGLGCNETCVNDPPCFPILVPPGDLRIKHRCIGFSRSSATCGSGSTSILLGRPRYREQINQITAFIDASNVYGSDDFESNQLRETLFDEGKMREGMPTAAGKHLLPFNIRGQVDCQADPQQDFVPCFKAGDHRSNENLGLLSMHTLWVREHNRLADGLRTLNPHWSGDRIFHEARKIVGGCMQAITYRVWLPIILGPKGMQLLGPYNGYDGQVNPTISNAFATAAMRFGHTLVPPIVFRLDENYNPIKEGHLLLHQAFFAPDRLLKDGGMDPIIRGLLYNGVRDRSRTPPLNSELTERLFAMAHELALDLAALNVQRGRDHGLPGYTEYAHKICGFGNSSYPDLFEDLRDRITKPELLEGLRRVYGHPGNIDLFTGGILEDLLPHARVGPTFACIIADQFRRLRDGDRFWYEAPGVFSPPQLAEIKRAGSSLSRIVCENADNITKVPENAFYRPARKADLVDCSSVTRLNLAVWKECPSTANAYYESSSYLTDTGRLEYAEPALIRRTRRNTNECEFPKNTKKQDQTCPSRSTDEFSNPAFIKHKIEALERHINFLLRKCSN